MDRAPRRRAPEVSVQPADAGPLQAPPPVPTPVGGAPRILILFSDTGGGHRAAARALTDALRLFDPTCVVTVADPLMAQGPLVVRRLASLYGPMIQRSRTAWGAVYHTSNTKPTFAAIRAVFGRGVRKATAELIHEHDPDVVLSVHPLLNHMTYQAIQKSGRRRALMTVITDLVDFHRGWTFSRADLVIAPTELARKVAIRRRVAVESIDGVRDLVKGMGADFVRGTPSETRYMQAQPAALAERRGLAEALRHGQIPLWDPLMNGGQPFLASPGNSALYPFNILFLFHCALSNAH